MFVCVINDQCKSVCAVLNVKLNIIDDNYRYYKFESYESCEFPVKIFYNNDRWNSSSFHLVRL